MMTVRSDFQRTVRLLESKQATRPLTEGFTRYWEPAEFTDAQWNKLMAEAKKIIRRAESSGIKIGGGAGNGGKPEITPKDIVFNGVGPDSHETFILAKEGAGNFCKTARKPYDRVVKEILAAAKEINPAFSISSDAE